MSGIEIALATAALAGSAASGYAQYQGSRNQAKMGEAAAAMRSEQAATALQVSSIQAREQEADRRRRLDITSSQGRAFAAMMGLDTERSGSLGVVDAENERIGEADISAIRMFGTAAQRRYQAEGRGAEMEGQSYRAMGANAWIAPTASFFGQAARTGLSAYQPLGGGADAAGKSSYRGEVIKQESVTGRMRGPV